MITAAKKDVSHKEIERQLKLLGIPYLDTSQLKGAFDMLVFFDGQIHAFEIKTREYASKNNQLPENRVNLLTPGEESMWLLADRGGVTIHIVFDIEEVLEIIGR